MREQTGGASLWRELTKVAHRISERTALLFLGVLGFEFFRTQDFFGKAALIRIRRLVRVMDGNEGQIFSAEIGWYSAIAPHVMTIRVSHCWGVFCFYGVKTKLEIRNEKLEISVARATNEKLEMRNCEVAMKSVKDGLNPSKPWMKSLRDEIHFVGY